MKLKPFIIDQQEIMKKLRGNSNGFYYMIYAVDRSSKNFSPYALK